MHTMQIGIQLNRFSVPIRLMERTFRFAVTFGVILLVVTMYLKQFIEVMLFSATPGSKMVNYYKYAPIVLMLMSFFFALPHYIWQVMLNLLHGLNLENVMEAATGMLDPISNSVTDDQADLVADRLLQFSQLEKAHQENPSASKRANLMARIGGGALTKKCSFRLPFSGCRLFIAYMITKVLYIVNVCLTLWGVGVFLDVSPWDYLGKIMRGLSFHPEYASQFSGRFPTVTICQYTGEAQVIGKLLRLTNICVIPFNIYYDKIFAVFYIIYVVLLVLFVVSVINWLYKCCNSQKFFEKYLRVDVSSASSALKQWDSIVSLDLIFVLRLIENNSDWIVAYHIVQKLQEKLSVAKKESLV